MDRGLVSTDFDARAAEAGAATVSNLNRVRGLHGRQGDPEPRRDFRRPVDLAHEWRCGLSTVYGLLAARKINFAMIGATKRLPRADSGVFYRTNLVKMEAAWPI